MPFDGIITDSGRPILLAGLDPTGLIQRMAGVTSARALLVDLVDSANRDLGIVDLGKAVPGATQGNNIHVSSGSGAAVQAVAARAGRVAVVIVPITDNVDVYYGYSSGVTTGTGIPVGLTKFMGTRIQTQAALWVVGTAAFEVAVAEEFD